MFFITPVVFKSIGKENYSLFVFAQQLTGYFSIVELGLGTGMSLKLYKPFAERNYEEIQSILLGFFYKFSRVFFLILFIGFFSVLLLYYFQNSGSFNTVFVWLILILSVRAAFSYLISPFQLLFSASQNGYKIAWIDGLFNVFVYSSYFFISANSDSVLWLAIIQLVSTLGIGLITFQRFKYHFPQINFDLKRIKNIRIQFYWKYIFISRLLNLVVFQTDYLFVAIFASVSKIGILSFYNTIFIILRDFVWMAFGAIGSGVGDLIARGNQYQIREFFNELIAWGGYFSLLIVPGFFLFTNEFINLWMRPDELFNLFFLIVMSINLYYLLYIFPISVFINTMGLFKAYSFVCLAEIIANVVLTIILGREIGLMGVILGTCISHFMIGFSFLPRIVSKEIANVLIHFYVRFFTFLTLIFISIWFNTKILNIISVGIGNQWLKLFIKVLIFVSFSFLFCLIAQWIDPKGKVLRRRLLMFFGSVNN